MVSDIGDMTAESSNEDASNSTRSYVFIDAEKGGSERSPTERAI